MELNLYGLDDGGQIEHRGSEGAVKLAIKMLNTIHEVGVKEED